MSVLSELNRAISRKKSAPAAKKNQIARKKARKKVTKTRAKTRAKEAGWVSVPPPKSGFKPLSAAREERLSANIAKLAQILGGSGAATKKRPTKAAKKKKAAKPKTKRAKTSVRTPAQRAATKRMLAANKKRRTGKK